MEAEGARVTEALSTVANPGQLDMNLAVLGDRLGRTIGLLERLKSAAQGVCTSLWLDELAIVNVPSLATRLLQAPVHISQWKELSARIGALMALTLVQGQFPTAEGLSDVKRGIPVNDQGEEVDPDEIFPSFLRSSSTWTTTWSRLSWTLKLRRGMVMSPTRHELKK